MTHSADDVRKDGLFLTDQDWHDLGSICQFWLETYRYVDRRTALAARIIAATHIDGTVSGE